MRLRTVSDKVLGSSRTGNLCFALAINLHHIYRRLFWVFFHFNYIMRWCDLLILKNNRASQQCASKQVYSALFANRAANFLKDK